MNERITLTDDRWIKDATQFPGIAQTVRSSRWKTDRRLRLWQEKFTPSEQRAAMRLFHMADTWSRCRVPASVTMTRQTLSLWVKLAAFCRDDITGGWLGPMLP